MRRAEFNVADENELTKLLDETSYGTLCLNDEPFAYMTPVNFIYHENSIYFHGAMSGRKYELSLKNKRASFSAVAEHSFIPSHFTSELACPASQFFASAFLQGELSLETDSLKKAQILDILMKKYQTEGKYLNIEKNLDKYLSMLGKTALFELQISSWSLKIKAGQNMKKEQFESVIEKLSLGGKSVDLATVEMMRKMRK
ncbi:MAG: pyridoxamine 5'-phosphate oxidase family protein [Campylobacteraceae bacterium]|jgi:nitroimidazol reductase NimA-like FMN-containing flavoprotein (pyridoxamine 5'-phosphate oxidase superfamily)|nr:pyridoxamine 5'-phosphate oxidase family protein [Campylobacteraceae bacterium]